MARPSTELSKESWHEIIYKLSIKLCLVLKFYIKNSFHDTILASSQFEATVISPVGASSNSDSLSSENEVLHMNFQLMPTLEFGEFGSDLLDTSIQDQWTCPVCRTSRSSSLIWLHMTLLRHACREAQLIILVRWLRVIMQVYQFPLDKSIKFCMVVP